MGIPVLIVGDSGSGKSASLRNFEKEEVGIFSVAGKPLPFKKKLNIINNANYDVIYSVLQKKTLKTYVIDDSQYLMAFSLFDRAKESGYGKFTDIGCDFQRLIRSINALPNDVIVYFLHHAEQTDIGKLKAKTVGKMLDNHLTLEGLFSIVLFCDIGDDNNHRFVTQSDGYNTAKSPMDMFPLYIDNDLKLVDTTIRNYYFEE